MEVKSLAWASGTTLEGDVVMEIQIHLSLDLILGLQGVILVLAGQGQYQIWTVEMGKLAGAYVCEGRLRVNF